MRNIFDELYDYDLFNLNETKILTEHSFRHFVASALISSGLDVVTVSGANVLYTQINLLFHHYQLHHQIFPHREQPV